MSKDIVLFVNSIHAPTYSALRAYEEKTGLSLKPVVVVDQKIKRTIHALNKQEHLYENAEIVTADFDVTASVRQALKPYEGRIFAITSQYENSIADFRKIIPHVPYLHTPTETSLDWATDKKLMREAFNAYDPALSPQSMQANDANVATIAAIESTMSYPMIIKPSGLERSLLVAAVHDRQELSKTLAHTFKEIHKAHKKWLKRTEPTVLVEELMQGDMYSIDSYISASGTFRHAPPIKVVTGRQAGFEDFFAYLQMTPPGLREAEIRRACHTAEQACKALGLRAVTAHTELMRTSSGWKIIEVGPRIGGYRHELYTLSHGLNHITNDILNRAGKNPEVPRQAQGHAAIFKTYAREEGLLRSIEGLEVVESLSSYVTMKLPYAKGDMLKFARNNGDAVIEVTLCHQNAGQLLADIQTLETTLNIRVTAKTANPIAA
jgi:biotin carboxylase